MSLSAREPAECGAGDLLLAGPRLLQRLSCGGGAVPVLSGVGQRRVAGRGLLKNERRPSREVRQGKVRELGLTGQKETRVRGTREIRVKKERLRESLT